MKITVGIDLSLTKTGIVVLRPTGDVILHKLVKSKPSGDKPVDETRRMIKIIEEVFDVITGSVDEIIPMVVIEGLAFLAKGTSLTQLAYLHHTTRAICEKKGWPFVICAPMTLKKFATGSGKGDKDMVSLAVYKNYGFEADDNNIADAFVLAAVGQAIIGTPIKKLFIPQKEVITLLKKQL